MELTSQDTLFFLQAVGLVLLHIQIHSELSHLLLLCGIMRSQLTSPLSQNKEIVSWVKEQDQSVPDLEVPSYN